MKALLAFLAAFIAVTPVTHNWPARSENASATRLLETFDRFGDDVSTIGRGVVPPEFLKKHAATIAALRAEIVSSPPPVWRVDLDDVLDAPYPPLRMHLRIFSILLADAQTNRAAAWTDLHAIWILSRTLLERPESTAVRVGRMGRARVECVAATLGGPMPAWWSEFKSFDVRKPLMRSNGYEAWRVVEDLARSAGRLFAR